MSGVHLNAYRSPGLITTRHSLDGVEFVASLVHHDRGLVQLWWPEWLIPKYDWGVNPDHLVVIDTGEASAFILVEVDESTERPPVIRVRLHAYASSSKTTASAGICFGSPIAPNAWRASARSPDP